MLEETKKADFAKLFTEYNQISEQLYEFASRVASTKEEMLYFATEEARLLDKQDAIIQLVSGTEIKNAYSAVLATEFWEAATFNGMPDTGVANQIIFNVRDFLKQDSRIL